MLRDPGKAWRVGVLAAACVFAGAQASGQAVHSPAGAVVCQADQECRSGFCDNGHCAQPQGGFGAPCTPAPRTAEGLRDAKLHACGAYLCTDGRCRSCVSDGQCQSELGAPRCVPTPGHPGFRCGR